MKVRVVREDEPSPLPSPAEREREFVGEFFILDQN
jgi:hypothetical protein